MTMLERAPLAPRDIEPVYCDIESNQYNKEQSYEAIHKTPAALLGERALAHYQSTPRELSPELKEEMRAKMQLIDSEHWREHVRREYGTSQWQLDEANEPPAFI